MKKLITFLVDFSSILEPKLVPKSTKNRPKIDQKSTKIDQKSIKLALGPQEAPRAPQDPSKAKNRSKVASLFGWLLGGFFGHVGPKSHQTATQHACKILIDFDIDFSSILGGFWEPCWPPRCIKNAFPIFNGLESIFYRFLFEFFSIFHRFLILQASSN